jgi:hypothetical protein
VSDDEAPQDEETEYAHLMAIAIGKYPPPLQPDPPHAEWYPMTLVDPEGKKSVFGVQVISTTNGCHAYWYNAASIKNQIQLLLQLLPMLQAQEAALGGIQVAAPADLEAMVDGMRKNPHSSLLLPPGT